MRQLTEEDIYKCLLGEMVIGDKYNSPIPWRRDNTPSFYLRYADNGQLRWYDQGIINQSEEIGTGVENLIACMRGFPTGPENSPERKIGYAMAKKVIDNEFKIGMIGKPPTQFRRKTKSDSVPYVLPGKYLDFELDYWKRYGITESDLLAEDIHPVRKMSYDGEFGFPTVESKPSDPAFVYWWNRNPSSNKIYRPLNKRDKFRQHNIDGVIEGWNTLKKAPTGLILSSTKDRLVVKKAFPEFTAINPRSEGEKSTIASKKNELLNFAPRWVVLYDADDPGFIGAELITKIINDPAFTFRDTRGKLDGNKDFSDYIDTQRGKHSYSDLVNVINNLINVR